MANGDTEKHILLVDDDEALLRTMADFLIHEGFDVEWAHDGRQALARMDERVPDLVVLDISMPGMGGIEFLKRIQNPDGAMRCPVLVLTARAVMQQFFDGIAVDAFLAKPCSQDELARHVHRILAAHEDVKKCAGRTKHKILIGEGDARRTEDLQRAFRQVGYDTVTVETGPEVLEKAIEELPDAILLNGILPGMNGDAVASLTRTLPGTRSIPVVLYDENRPLAGFGHYGWKVPAGVVAIGGAFDSWELLKAVKGVIGSAWPGTFAAGADGASG